MPYLTHGLAAWGQAAKTHEQKILELHKRVLRLMYFSEPRAHALPLFISSKILPLQMLYAEKVSSIMEKSISIMETEDDYVEVPTLLQKMANSASSTQCTNNSVIGCWYSKFVL